MWEQVPSNTKTFFVVFLGFANSAPKLTDAGDHRISAFKGESNRRQSS